MILLRFNFVQPFSIQETISLLAQNSGKAKIIAGGTDLLVNMKKKLVKPELLISMDKIDELKETLPTRGNGLKIGSLSTMADIAESRMVKNDFPALAQAAGKLGSRQIRNRATIGGNICSARPCADSIGPLIGYGAEVKLIGTEGERLVSLDDFCTGPGETILGSSEILTEIWLKPPPPNTNSSYIKFGTRKAMDIAIVSVTSVITVNSSNGKCQSARVVLGAVAPTYIRCSAAEEVLVGDKITDDIALQAGTLAAQFCRPISDMRGSAEYRRMLVEALTRRSILEASRMEKL